MKTKTEKFIHKIRLKNNPNHFNKDGSFRYDYSKTVYIHSKTKIIIGCPIHGYFEQIPNSHLLGNGCSKCRSSFTTKSFIEKANKVHSCFYRYMKTVYLASTGKVIITCPKHGDFKQSAASHLAGNGCSICGGEKISKSKTYSKNDFVVKANKVHDNKYTYNDTVYKASQTKITITCPKHGNFEQLPYSHLNGHGCLKCGSNGGGSIETFITNCNNNNDGKGIFYIIRCSNESESFYKLGITSRSIKARYKNKLAMPYDYEILTELIDDAATIYNMEKYLLKKFENNTYEPFLYFKGVTECFTSIELI